ncbi:FadR/GntR family transcriptional regulator [Streptomyces sp. NPDC005811]|uniref:FadR/GntR family transcriptional regulator n=1 Tax=Streptomyces sp. NPDC005811 TaxID=3154565 RepID=UPI0033F0225B
MMLSVQSAAEVEEGDAQWRRPPGRAPRSTAEDVHARLKNMIHTGELGPGDRLPPERRLCAMLEVSRSTLREGLSALRADGYLEARRGAGGGTFISRLDEPYARWLTSMRSDKGRLRDIMDLRSAVECEIALLAAERGTEAQLQGLSATLAMDGSELGPGQFREADAQFHGLLAEAAASPRLKALMVEARGELFAPASTPLIDEPTIARSHAEHQAILEAVRARDPLRAAQSMRAHLHSTFVDVSSVIDGPHLRDA